MKRMWSKNEVKNLSKEVIESGQVDNAKPIYCHPIFLDCNISEGEYAPRRYYLTLLIFNNDKTQFTLETFKTYIANMCNNYNAKFMCSGSGFYNNITIIACNIRNLETNNPCLYGLKSGTKDEDYISLSLITSENTAFNDGVNKIN